MNIQRKKLSILTVILMGFISLIVQTLIIREIIVQFQGNELTIGIILANWLFFESIGAYITGFFLKKNHILKIAIYLQSFIIIILICVYFFILKFKPFLGIEFGETVGLIPTILIPGAALFLLCIPLGFHFALSCQLLNKFMQNRKGAYNISQSYYYEAIGWFLGGVFFNFILLIFFNNLQILFILLLVSVINLLLYLNIYKSNILRDAFLMGITFLSILLFLTFDNSINKYLNKVNSAYKLLNIQNSKYGKIHVIKYKNQINVYQNGILTYSSDNILNNEEIIHLSLLRKPKVKKVALIGGGLTNGINEILKYPNIEKIYYCELDPNMIKICKKYYNYPYYKNKKVNTISQDGRYFINNFNKEKLGAIIVNLPDPSTSQLNRYYTLDFFKKVEQVLKKDGIFSLNLSSSQNYISKNLKQFNLSILNAMEKTFKSVDIIPGDSLILVGTNNPTLLIKKETMIKNLKYIKKKNKYINKYYLKYRLNPEKLKYFKSIVKQDPSNILNTDYKPITYYYYLSRWMSVFKTESYKVFEFLQKIICPKFLLIFIAVIFSIIFFLKKFMFKHIDLFSISFSIGFTGMALQLIIIYLYQSFYGYIYSYISILTACYMSGLSLGSFFLNYKKQTKVLFVSHIKKSLLTLSLVIIALPYLLQFIEKYNVLSNISFPIFAFINGFFTGSIFNSLNKTWLKNKKSFSFVESGTFYSLDLLGGTGSAILSSIIFIPLLGLEYYSIILGFIVLMNYVLFKF